LRAPSSDRGRRERSRRSTEWMTRVALWMLAGTVVIAPQLLGGRFGWGITIIALLAGGCCATAGWSARGTIRGRVPWMVLVMIALVAWTAFQALPLPRTFVEIVQPLAVDRIDAAYALLDEPPPYWIPLSLSPAGTQAEIVKGLGIAAAFIAAWLLASLGQRSMVIVAVGASTCAMALVKIGHLAADADAVFGVYDDPNSGAPLINMNHLSGFLALGAPILAGAAMHARERGQRILWIAGSVFVGATALIATSRGGAASLVFGMMVLGVCGLWRSLGSKSKRPVAMPILTIGAALAAALGLGLYVAAESLYVDFERGDASKLEIAWRGLELALTHPWTGVGRGAFSAAMTAHFGGMLRYTHPENVVAQWCSEWGLVVGLTLVVLLGMAFFRAVRGTRHWLHLGGAAALASIAAHDLVDFSMENVGVAVVVAALAGAVLAPHESARSRAARSRSSVGSIAIAVSVAAVLAGIVLGLRIDSVSEHSLRRQIEGAMRAEPLEDHSARIREAIRLHPAEPAFVVLGGANAVRRGEPSAISWLNHAMVLAPGWSSPHELAAEFLVSRRNFTQALLEARRAQELRPGSGSQIACRIVAAHHSLAATFVRVAGRDDEGTLMLDQTAACLALDSPAAMEIDEQLTRRRVIGASLRAARRALARGDHAAAEREMSPWRRTQTVEVAVTRADIAMAAGRPNDAARILERAERWTDNPSGILRQRALALAAAGEAEEMRRVVERLRGRAAGSADVVATTWLLQGQLEQQLGNHGRAMQAYERAARLDPDGQGLMYVALLSDTIGNYARSLRAWNELCTRGGPSSDACAQRDRVRARLAESPLSPPQRIPAP
jgi:tetratricopeptide (TPR) repeat protein